LNWGWSTNKFIDSVNFMRNVWLGHSEAPKDAYKIAIPGEVVNVSAISRSQL
jgi:hypothetical protein